MRFFMNNKDYKDAVKRLPNTTGNTLIDYFERANDPIPFPDPTSEMLNSPEFEAVWQCIKHWDINVPGAYAGYCGAMGNHVRAILDALSAVKR